METNLKQIGDLAWRAFQSVNARVPEGRSVEPGWAPGPIPKSHERTRPPLGSLAGRDAHAVEGILRGVLAAVRVGRGR